jgi:hypothetical protein
MFILAYEPLTTEIIFKDVADPVIVATFTEFYVTKDLTLTQGTVVVLGFIEVDPGVVLTIDGQSVLEIK